MDLHTFSFIYRQLDRIMYNWIDSPTTGYVHIQMDLFMYTYIDSCTNRYVHIHFPNAKFRAPIKLETCRYGLNPHAR